MWNGLWKLAAMAGVIAIGLGAVFVVQQGTKPKDGVTSDVAAAGGQSELGSPSTAAKNRLDEGESAPQFEATLPSRAALADRTNHSHPLQIAATGTDEATMEAQARAFADAQDQFAAAEPERYQRTRTPARTPAPLHNRTIQQVAHEEPDAVEDDPFADAAPKTTRPSVGLPTEVDADDPFGDLPGDQPSTAAAPATASEATDERDPFDTESAQSLQTPSRFAPTNTATTSRAAARRMDDEPSDDAPAALGRPGRLPTDVDAGRLAPSNDSDAELTPMHRRKQSPEPAADDFGAGVDLDPGRLPPKSNRFQTPRDEERVERSATSRGRDQKPFRAAEEDGTETIPSRTPAAVRESTDEGVTLGNPSRQPTSAAPQVLPRGERINGGGTASRSSADTSDETTIPRRRNGVTPTSGNDLSPFDEPPVADEVDSSPIPSRTSRSAQQDNRIAPAHNTPRHSATTDDGLPEHHGDGTADPNLPRAVQQPRLSIEKIAPPRAILGQNVIYSVLVKNTGNAEARHVTVEDRIPKGAKCTGTSPQAELVDDTRLIWKLDILRPGEEKKISIRVIPTEEGPIGSVAKVSTATEVTAEILVQAPVLTLQAEVPSKSLVGEPMEMKFIVRNSGEVEANNVVVRNLLPEGFKHAAGNDLMYTIGRLPANESRTMTLEVLPTRHGKVVNKAIVTADGGISIERDAPILIEPIEELVLTRSAPSRLYLSRTGVFVNKIANAGQGVVREVRVTEQIPAGMEFLEANERGHYDPRTRTLTWTVGPLSPGDEVTLTSRMTAQHKGQQLATINAAGSGGTTASVDSQLQAEGMPSLTMESLSELRAVAVGERVTSRIQLRNRGQGPAKNVELSMEIPTGLKIVSVQGPVRYTTRGHLVTFESIPEVGVDGAAVFEVTMEAMSEGDGHLNLQIAADHLQRPVSRRESIPVVSELR